MTKWTAKIANRSAALAGAVLCGSMLLAATVTPAAARPQPMGAKEWKANVSRQLDGSIRQINLVSDDVRQRSAAIVAVHFDDAGQMHHVSLEHGTGERLLDKEAVRAVRSLRYPTLPAEMRGKVKVVAMEVFFGDPQLNPGRAQVRVAANKVLDRLQHDEAHAAVPQN